MRILRRAIRTIALTIFAVVALAAGGVALLLWHPSWLLGGSALRFAASELARQGVSITWTTERARAQSLSWARKRLSLDFTGLCVRDNRQGVFELCFDRASVTAEAGLRGLSPRIFSVGPVLLLGGRARLELARVPPSGPATRFQAGPPPPIAQVIPAWLAGARVGRLRIELRRFDVQARALGIGGTLLLSQEEFPTGMAGSRLKIASAGEVATGAGRRAEREKFRFDAELLNPRSIWAWNSWTATIDASATLADRRAISLSAVARPRFPRTWAIPDVGFDARGSTALGASVIAIGARGTAGPRRIEARLQGSARETAPGLHKLTVKNCSVLLARDGTPFRARYTVDCRVSATLPLAPERLRFLQLPQEASARVRADLASTDLIPSGSSRLNGSVGVTLEPILTPLVRVRAALDSRVSGAAGEFPKRGRIESRFAIGLDVPRFEAVVRRLSGTDWAVPAPFLALKGSLSFAARGGTNLRQGLFPLRFRTRLRSPSQRMDIDASGAMELSGLKTHPFAQLNVAVIPTDLKLVLPRLDLGAPPRLTPDSRIGPLPTTEQAGQAGGEEHFGFRALIRTPPGRPVQVVSNLAKGPIPAELDLVLASNSPVAGRIRVGKFPVELFKRKATVDHFDLALAPAVGDSKVDGLVQVPLEDYQTRVQVVGTVEKPKVSVTSEPPLSEEQLLSALLFNQAPEDLDTSQSATLGSTRATLTTGALNLASLFLLASTPIQSLSYNPDTGQVMAQVRLVEGLSLSLAAGANQAETVGLRKRLGSNWFVTTSYNNFGGVEANTVSANLEWRKRY